MGSGMLGSTSRDAEGWRAGNPTEWLGSCPPPASRLPPPVQPFNVAQLLVASGVSPSPSAAGGPAGSGGKRGCHNAGPRATNIAACQPTSAGMSELVGCQAGASTGAPSSCTNSPNSPASLQRNLRASITDPIRPPLVGRRPRRPPDGYPLSRRRHAKHAPKGVVQYLLLVQ